MRNGEAVHVDQRAPSSCTRESQARPPARLQCFSCSPPQSHLSAVTLQVALSKDMWPIWMDDCVMSTHAAESRKGGRTSRRAHRVAAADRTVIPHTGGEPERSAPTQQDRLDGTHTPQCAKRRAVSSGCGVDACRRKAQNVRSDAARGLLWLRRGWLSTESSKCAKRRAVSPLLAAWMRLSTDQPRSRALRCQGPRQVLPRVPTPSAWAPQASCVVNIAACRHSMMKSSL